MIVEKTKKKFNNQKINPLWLLNRLEAFHQFFINNHDNPAIKFDKDIVSAINKYLAMTETVGELDEKFFKEFYEKLMEEKVLENHSI